MEISRESLKAMLAAIREGSVSILEASGAPSKGLNLAPGTEVSGEVLARQPNGRYVVRVNGELLDMALPGDVPVGSSQKMTYVGDQPRLTFAVSSQNPKGSEVNISNASRWLVTLTSKDLPTPDSETIANLSSARMFDALPADKNTIALRLREVVRRSGIFYESHLEQWTNGGYPLEELLQEPQGQRSSLTRMQPPENPASDPASLSRLSADGATEKPVNTPSNSVKEPGPHAKADNLSTPRGKTLTSLMPAMGTSPQTGQPAIAAIESAAKDNNGKAALSKEHLQPESGYKPSPSTTTFTAKAAGSFITKSLILPEKPASTLQDPESSGSLTASQGKRSDSTTFMPEPLSGTISDAKSTPQTKPEMTEAGAASPEKLPVSNEGKTSSGINARAIDIPNGTDSHEPNAPPASEQKNSPGLSRDAASSLQHRSSPSADGPTTSPLPASQKGAAATILMETKLPSGSESPKPSRELQTPVRAEGVGQPSQQQEPNELQPRTIRQRLDQPQGRQLPLVAPEIKKPESVLNQSREMAAQTSKLASAQFEPPDSHTLPVVRQQLELLNTGQFVWQGEAWQGQQLEWTIRRDGKRKQPADSRSWDTSLRLELPNLGAIAASVSISGNQVRLSITAEDMDAAAMMQTNRNRLIEGMDSGGLLLAGMEVKHEPTPR